MQLAIDPVCDAFRQLWPQARVTNCSRTRWRRILPRRAASRRPSPAFRRACALQRALRRERGSFHLLGFRTAIEEAKRSVRIPVLKPNEAMLEDALAVGSDVALLTTFEPSIPSLKAELEQLATDRGIKVRISTRSIPEASWRCSRDARRSTTA
jgi:hypothetical protein